MLTGDLSSRRVHRPLPQASYGVCGGALGAEICARNVLRTAAHFIAFNAGVIALVHLVALDGLSLPVAAGRVVLVCGIPLFAAKIAGLRGALLSYSAAYLIAAITLGRA